MRFIDSILAGIVLNREAIQSDNFVTGISGWRVRKIGDAEFNNLSIRGTFSGNYFILNTSGLFFYSGSPALGNMTGSWASAAGTDSFGNAYPAGLKIYSALGSVLLDATDGILQSLSANNNLVNINDGQITITAVGNSSTATFIQNDRGTTNGSLCISGGKQNASDVAAFLGLVTKTTGNSPLVQIAAASGGQCNFVNESVDQGRGVQSFITLTSNVTLSATPSTEATLMTVPSMTFVNGRAYRVDVWGLQQTPLASDTYLLYQLRKGTGIAGTVYKGQMRERTLGVAATNNPVSRFFYLVNTSGADITTTVTLTASSPTASVVFAASAGNQASATVVDVGLASQYPGQAIS